MSHRPLIHVAALCGILAAPRAGAATAEVIVTSTPTPLFDPQTVTIHVGDTVLWNNVDGTHNVLADDGTFTSGAPAAAPWTYSHVFAAVGTFGYYCLPHGVPAMGQFGTVVVLPEPELAHGSDRIEDLAAGADSYRIGQKPYSSYEVVVDPLGGPMDVDRVDAGSVLIQAGQPVSATIDMAQSLRWQNATASPVDSEHVRVGCNGACTAGNTYRVRMYETTLALPRYNNSGSQVSVLILQNPADYAIAGRVYFWSVSGALVNGTGTAFALSPKSAFALSGSSVPGVPGTAGTVTVSHDGRYGDLVGKVVALEPSTGFSFDTPALARPH